MSDKDKLTGDELSLEIIFKKNDEKNELLYSELENYSRLKADRYEERLNNGNPDIGYFENLKIEMTKGAPIDISLDELSELSEHWKRNREAGRSAKHIKIAIVELAKEIVALDECF